MIYRNLSEAFGWTPEQISRLTEAQIAMYADAGESEVIERPNDWSRFGLWRDGNTLRGPDKSLEKYMEYRKKLKEQDG